MVIALYYKYNMKYACNSFIKALRDKKTVCSKKQTVLMMLPHLFRHEIDESTPNDSAVGI